MPGLLELMQPKNLGQVSQPMNPDMMRMMLRQQFMQQGRKDIDVNTLSPDQMMMLLQRQPISTTGIRG
jgi:hypothetical protein